MTVNKMALLWFALVHGAGSQTLEDCWFSLLGASAGR